MADELAGLGPDITFAAAAHGLARRPLLILSADDGLAAGTDALIAAVRANGGVQAVSVHVPTDHSWSDARIRLESEVVSWLATLSGAPQVAQPRR
jgi:uncharacterized protein